jgi:hypothetical protein
MHSAGFREEDTEVSYLSCKMKTKDITELSERWSTALGTMDAEAPVADGVRI